MHTYQQVSVCGMAITFTREAYWFTTTPQQFESYRALPISAGYSGAKQ